jgi:hypothetical protein
MLRRMGAEAKGGFGGGGRLKNKQRQRTTCGLGGLHASDGAPCLGDGGMREWRGEEGNAHEW